MIVLEVVGTICLFVSLVQSHGIVNDPSPAIYPGGGTGVGVSTLRPWPSNIINYRYTLGTGLSDLTALRTAMEQIRVDTGGCIVFQPAPTNYVGPFLSIKQRATPTVPEQSCYGFHGFYPNAQQNSGQLMVAFGGTAGTNTQGACLDTPRDAMRVLVNAVGLRNEWMSAKRAGNMLISSNANNLVVPALQTLNIFSDTRIYPANEVMDVQATQPFDTRSVTMIRPERFAADPTNPPFRLATTLPDVGYLARLSLYDCQTIQFLYRDFCPSPTACVDPYTAAAGSPTFYPTATIKRSLQCQNTGATPLVIGELLISGVPVLAVPAAGTNPVSAQIVNSPIAGLRATLFTRNLAVVTPATGNLGPCTQANQANGACQYSVRFLLDQLPSITTGNGGPKNQQLTVNILNGNTVLYTMSVTVTLNCAPVFQTITANIGPNPQLVGEKVYRFPVEITSVGPPPLKDTDRFLSANNGDLAQFIVNYNTPAGIGEAGAPTLIQDTTPKKVFINCALADRMGGSTVVGVVSATDPEGDAVSYFAYSGDYRAMPAAAANPFGAVVAAGPELHSVTKEGVISISGVVNPIEARDYVAGQGNPGGGGTDNANGGMVSGAQALVNTVPKNIFIVAVDSRGGQSILQARFNLACGQAIP